MKKNISVLLIVIMLLSIVVGGCNKSTVDQAKQPEQQTSTSTDVKKVDYPTKPISLIVNYGAGGGTDLATRALAQAAEKILGQSITIINKTGGSGSVGIVETMNSKTDGYTVGVLTYAPMAIVPHQMEVPYTPDDFDYICTYGQYGYGIVVKADSPYESLEDIVELARNTTGGLGYSASGYPQPFAMNAVGEKEEVQFNYIPYTSASEVLTAVLGGHVQVAVGGQAEIMQYLKSGEMRLLAACGESRWETEPDVQTLTEMGYDIALKSYMGLGVPKGVDPEILEILRDTFNEAFEDDAFQKVLSNMNLVTSYTTGEDYEEYVKQGYIKNAELIK